jgi:hypothetical protein
MKYLSFIFILIFALSAHGGRDLRASVDNLILYNTLELTPVSGNHSYPTICFDDAKSICAATYSTDANWIRLDASSFMVDVNDGKFRTAQIIYLYENKQSKTLTINQEGICAYSLSKTESPLLNASGINQIFKFDNPI